MSTVNPSRLSDRELEAEVARLARCERAATASLIATLAELYGRRLHERAGFSSLFTYRVEVLRLSEHEAYDRMKAAKVVRRYPAVLGLLASGQVNLTTVRLLAPHLTRKNHEELLDAASGKRKRQVQELLARKFPKPDVATSVRKLPARDVGLALPARDLETALPAPDVPLRGHQVGLAPSPIASSITIPAPIPTPPRPVVSPLAPDRYRITFTATQETCEKLELAQDLLRHAIPNGDPAQIFARALDVLVKELVKEKFAVTRTTRTSPGQRDDSRHIPADVKRAVFGRDRGRCAFRAAEGRTCGERAFVEFHHVVPYAAGGRPTVENIELRCRAHNGYEAEMLYGPARRHVSAEIVKEATTAHACVSADAFRSGTTVTSGRALVAGSSRGTVPGPTRDGPMA
jgi:hypothetical protein